MTTDILQPLDDDSGFPPFAASPSLDDLPNPVNDLDGDEDATEDANNKPSPRKAARVKVTPAVVRRVIERHEDLTNADGDNREMLAAALGVKNDPTDLTVASLTAGRNALSSVDELLGLANSDNPFAAMVSALAFERDTARRVWQLLIVVGAVDGGLPTKNEVAGAKVAEAALALSDDQKVSLSAVKALVG